MEWRTMAMKVENLNYIYGQGTAFEQLSLIHILSSLIVWSTSHYLVYVTSEGLTRMHSTEEATTPLVSRLSLIHISGITAIATICMVLVIRVKDKAYIFIKRRFPSMRETAFGYNPISCLHYTTLPRWCQERENKKNRFEKQGLLFTGPWMVTNMVAASK